MHVACNLEHPEQAHQPEDSKESKIERKEGKIKWQKGHKVNQRHRRTDEFYSSLDRVIIFFLFNNGINAENIFNRKENDREYLKAVKDMRIL